MENPKSARCFALALAKYCGGSLGFFVSLPLRRLLMWYDVAVDMAREEQKAYDKA